MCEGVSDDTIIANVPELQEISDKREQKEAIERLKWATNMLMVTARHLKAKRTQHGALELESVEVQVQITPETTSDSDKTIEDLIPKKVTCLLGWCHSIAFYDWLKNSIFFCL